VELFQDVGQHRDDGRTRVEAIIGSVDKYLHKFFEEDMDRPFGSKRGQRPGAGGAVSSSEDVVGDDVINYDDDELVRDLRNAQGQTLEAAWKEHDEDSEWDSEYLEEEEVEDEDTEQVEGMDLDDDDDDD